MGRYARRAIIVTALALGGITAFLTFTNLGSKRVFLFFLFSALVTAMWAVAGSLMRSDRGIISATRLIVAALQDADSAQDPEAPDPASPSRYAHSLKRVDV